MNYLEIKEQLIEEIQSLAKQLEDKSLSAADYEAIKRKMDNYQYILELTEMNHYHRGFKH